MTAANLVSTTVAKRYQAVPVAFADKRTLLVAMADPSNVLAVDDIAIMTGYEIRVAVAAARRHRGADLAPGPPRRRRRRVRPTSVEEADEDGAEVVALHETSDDAPVVKLVNQIVAQARRARRLRHPPRPRRPRAARALPHRRRAAGRHDRPAADGRRGGLAHQDHGRAGHRREAPAPGRARRAGRRRPPRRPARRDAAERPRRGRRDARPRQGTRSSSSSTSSAWPTPSANASNAPAARRTARCS